MFDCLFADRQAHSDFPVGPGLPQALQDLLLTGVEFDGPVEGFSLGPVS